MTTTQEAKTPGGNINLRGTIKNIGAKRDVSLKTGGSTTVCDAEVHDEAGSIKLTLWGEEADQFRNGDTIEITNGYSRMFRDEPQVSRGKFGSLKRI